MRAAEVRRLPSVPRDHTGWDYADCFELRVSEPDPRTAEQFARVCLEQAPRVVRGFVRFAHVHLLRFRLAPMSSAQHVLGWDVVVSEPDVVQLEAVSPLLGRGVILGRRTEPTRMDLTTYVYYARGLSRLVWWLIRPVHRIAARVLLLRAARHSDA